MMCQSQEAHLYVIVNSQISPCIFSRIVYAYQEMQKHVWGRVTKILNAIFSLET